jgi:hypothetical protein
MEWTQHQQHQQYMNVPASSYGPYSVASALAAPQIHLSQDDNMLDVDMQIDPSLYFTSPQPWAAATTPLQPIDRYVQEHQQKAGFLHLGPPLAGFQNPNAMRPVPSLPAASFRRHGSPMSSSHEPSNCGSAALSPAADSEYPFDSPTTPSDRPLLSPSLQRGGIGHWNTKYMPQPAGPMPVDDITVNPMAVSSQQDVLFGYEESRSNSFAFELPRDSLDSYSHQPEYDFVGGSAAAYGQRMTSPEEMRPEIKDEIYVRDVDHYGAGPGDAFSEAEDGGPPTARRGGAAAESGEESDYHPARRTAARRAAGASRAAKAVKRPPPQKSSPGSKRQKVGGKGGNKGALACGECGSSSFRDAAALQQHVRKQHTRAFTCVFHFAGCESTFASKNEWKRHVMSQHLLLTYWLCTEGGCAKTVNAPAKAARGGGHRDAHAALPNGAIFNRKDLFTQHIRRMHTPAAAKKLASKGKGARGAAAGAAGGDGAGEFEEHLRDLQQHAEQVRCRLPGYMRCPVPGCEGEFRGTDAWDLRMEHVARHLERAAKGEEADVEFGGDGDATLMEWATDGQVGVVVWSEAGWVLNNPLRHSGAAAGAGAKGSVNAAAHGRGGKRGEASAGRLGAMEEEEDDDDDEDEDAHGEPE